MIKRSLCFFLAAMLFLLTLPGCIENPDGIASGSNVSDSVVSGDKVSDSVVIHEDEYEEDDEPVDYSDYDLPPLIGGVRRGNFTANLTQFSYAPGHVVSIAVCDDDWIYLGGRCSPSKISKEAGSEPIEISFDENEMVRYRLDAWVGWMFGIMHGWIYGINRSAGSILRISTDGKITETVVSAPDIDRPMIVGNRLYYTSSGDLCWIGLDGNESHVIFKGDVSNYVYVPYEDMYHDGSYSYHFYIKNVAYPNFYTSIYDDNAGYDIYDLYCADADWGGEERWLWNRLYTDTLFCTFEDGCFYKLSYGEAYNPPYEIYRFPIYGNGERELIAEMDACYHMIHNGRLYCNKNGSFCAINLETKKIRKICDDFVINMNVAGGWLFCESLDDDGKLYGFRVRPDGADRELLYANINF